MRVLFECQKEGSLYSQSRATKEAILARDEAGTDEAGSYCLWVAFFFPCSLSDSGVDEAEKKGRGGMESALSRFVMGPSRMGAAVSIAAPVSDRQDGQEGLIIQRMRERE